MKKGCLIALLLLTLVECSDDENLLLQNTATDEVSADVVCLVGEKITDPYRIDNIRKAYRRLYAADSTSTPKIDIRPTHKYLRFLPKNADELELLRSDTTIEWFPYPLDYIYPEDMSEYHDPELPADAITYQYCVLPIDYAEPNVAHTLLYECYFPDEAEGIAYNDKRNSIQNNDVFNDKLEIEAFKIVGLLKNSSQPTERGVMVRKASRYKPCGTIKVWDDAVSDYVPVPKAKIRVSTATRTKKAYTDANGYYEIDANFLLTANHTIWWETNDWDIRDGAIAQAFHNGPHCKGEWSWNIPRTSKQYPFATITRATYRHIYGSNFEIQRPIFTRKTKIAYIDQEIDGVAGCFIGYASKKEYIAVAGAGTIILSGTAMSVVGSTGILTPMTTIMQKITTLVPIIQTALAQSPDVLIFKNKTSYKMYHTVCHELGHYSEYLYLGGFRAYKMFNARLRESYANAIAWVFTKDEYTKLFGDYKKNTDILSVFPNAKSQNWPYSDKSLSDIKSNIEYSPIFIDLIDNVNQRNYTDSDWFTMTPRTSTTNISELPNDQISGFTIKQIQNNISSFKSYSDVRDYVKNAWAGSNKRKQDIVDALFTIYEKYDK